VLWAAKAWEPLAATTLSMPNTAGEIYRWCGFRKQCDRPVTRHGGGHQASGSIITQLADDPEEALTTGPWVHRFDRPRVERTTPSACTPAGAAQPQLSLL
jgi:hypothetical protein